MSDSKSTEDSYLGEYNGHTIEIERDKDHGNDFYIRVYNDEGYAYDGWWDESADATIEEAISQAKDGALLDSKEDDYTRLRTSQIDSRIELGDELESILMHFAELSVAGDPEKELVRAKVMCLELFDQELAKRDSLTVAGKEVRFSHTAVNGDMHMFIDGYHNPRVCPECIQPGLLFATLKTQTTEEDKR